MRPNKELILATRPYASEVRLKSWWYTLSTLFLLAVVTIGTLWNFHILAKIGCSILSGFIMVRMFVIYHDYHHEAILQKSLAAQWIMRIFGLVSLTPSSIWESSHNHHHHHNSKLKGSHIGSFPIMTKDRFAKATTKERLQYLFMRHPLTIFFGYFSVFMFGMCVYPFFNDPRRHFDSIISLLVNFSLMALLAWFGGWPAVLLALVGPQFIAGALGSYLFYAQHNFPGVVLKDNSGWTYEGAALESSSFMKMNAVMHWFTANIGYHHIHHLNARIPFYRLPEIMSKIPELQKPKTTSLHPVEVLRCLRLKVWDAEKQCMVPLDGTSSNPQLSARKPARESESSIA